MTRHMLWFVVAVAAASSCLASSAITSAAKEVDFNGNIVDPVQEAGHNHDQTLKDIGGELAKLTKDVQKGDVDQIEKDVQAMLKKLEAVGDIGDASQGAFFRCALRGVQHSMQELQELKGDHKRHDQAPPPRALEDIGNGLSKMTDADLANVDMQKALVWLQHEVGGMGKADKHAVNVLFRGISNCHKDVNHARAAEEAENPREAPATTQNILKSEDYDEHINRTIAKLAEILIRLQQADTLKSHALAEKATQKINSFKKLREVLGSDIDIGKKEEMIAMIVQAQAQAGTLTPAEVEMLKEEMLMTGTALGQ